MGFRQLLIAGWSFWWKIIARSVSSKPWEVKDRLGRIRLRSLRRKKAGDRRWWLDFTCWILLWLLENVESWDVRISKRRLVCHSVTPRRAQRDGTPLGLRCWPRGVGLGRGAAWNLKLATTAWFTCDISLRYRYHSMLLLGMTTFSPEDSWHTPYLQVDLWLFVQCTCTYIYIWIDPRYVTWCHLPFEDRWTFAILLARKQARMDDVSRCWKTTPEWMPLKKRQHWSLFRGKMMGHNGCLL